MPNTLTYLDFEIDVAPDIANGGYTVSVVNSPAGEVREASFLPFGELALKNRLQALQIALLSSGGTRRGLTTHEQKVQDFGKELFAFLLPDEVRGLYRISRSRALAVGQGLRLKLRMADPALAALPWEFLFDAVHNEYICLSTQTPLVRYLELAHPPRPLQVSAPLRILGMIASPDGVDALDVELEKQRVAVNHSVEWGTPVLHMRAPDGQVFDLQGKRQREEGKSGSGVAPVVEAVSPSIEVATVRAAVVTPPAPQFPIEIDWVTIPAGEFLMGSDKAQDSMAQDSELPQHRLYLPEYRISRTPVTNAQYLRFVEAMKYTPPQHWTNGRIPDGKGNHPVVYVSWLDAIAFCGWAGVRLPSEAEWEKAARGTDGRIWPWGNQPPDDKRCNFRDSKIGDTTPVDRYPSGASPYGVLDMAGNVWEWTSSLFKDYPYRADDGREKETEDGTGRRVLRGGAYYFSPEGVRCAYRNGRTAWRGNGSDGFRLATGLSL